VAYKVFGVHMQEVSSGVYGWSVMVRNIRLHWEKMFAKKMREIEPIYFMGSFTEEDREELMCFFISVVAFSSFCLFAFWISS